MNYIELAQQFWQCNNELPLGPNATAIYFYLLNVCNSLGWKETFRHSDRHISINLGISVNTVRLAKNKLKQLGLIDFKSPEKASRGLDGSTVYKLKTVSKFDMVPDTVPDMVSDTVPDMVPDTVPDTRTILNITNIKREGKTSEDCKKNAAEAATLSRRKNFHESLVPFTGKYPDDMIMAFSDYWSEMNASRTRMRFETEKTWELPRRLSTWARRDNQFKSNYKNGNENERQKRKTILPD